jgi:NADH-quinone oxidoreductase subunit F
MGTINLATLVEKIERGEGSQKDLDSLLQLCGFVKGTGYCTLITGAAVLVQSSLRLFQHEFEEHIRLQRCPFQPAQAGTGVKA